MSSILEIKKDFSVFLPPLIHRSFLAKESRGYENTLLKKEDVKFVIESFKRNCTIKRDIGAFYYYVGMDSSFLYGHPYPTVCTMDMILNIYEQQRKDFALVYKMLVDVHSNIIRYQF